MGYHLPALNRTMKELKITSVLRSVATILSLNRTMKELKKVFIELADHHITLLIAP